MVLIVPPKMSCNFIITGKTRKGNSNYESNDIADDDPESGNKGK